MFHPGAGRVSAVLVAGCVALLAVLAAPASLRAQDGAPNPRREDARRALQQAEAHMEAGRYALAARGFEDVYHRMVEMGMERAPLMHWNLGLALLEISGRERAARDAFQRFLTESEALSNDELVASYRLLAAQHVAELDARQEIGTGSTSTRAGGADGVLTGLGIAALGLAAASGGLAVGFLLERNRNAESWNDHAGCLAVDPERTRGENCGPFADAAQSNETAAIVTTITAGVLVAAGIPLLAVGLASGGGGETATISCGPTGLGLSCAGRF